MVSKILNKTVKVSHSASQDGVNGTKLDVGVKRDHRHGGISRRRPAQPKSSLKRETLLNSSSNSGKLIVANLDYAVTDTDLCKLFSGTGRLICSRVQYDGSGRSLGSAEVIFKNRVDAIEARKLHNSKLFNGRELRIHLATKKEPEKSQIRSIQSRLLRNGSRQSSSERSSDGPSDKQSKCSIDRAPRTSDESHGSRNKKSRLGSKTTSRKINKTPTTAKPGGGVMRDNRHGGISRRRPTQPKSSLKREAVLNSSSNKLIVSNLAYAATNRDVSEVFGAIGRLISSCVKYDRSGKSLGSAEIVFENQVDAFEAKRVYNGELFKGRKLVIHLTTTKGPEWTQIRSIQSRLGACSKEGDVPKTSQNNGPSDNGGESPTPTNEPTSCKETPTAEDIIIDAELAKLVTSCMIQDS